jgi:hypothetical protein
VAFAPCMPDILHYPYPLASPRRLGADSADTSLDFVGQQHISRCIQLPRAHRPRTDLARCHTSWLVFIFIFFCQQISYTRVVNASSLFRMYPKDYDDGLGKKKGLLVKNLIRVKLSIICEFIRAKDTSSQYDLMLRPPNSRSRIVRDHIYTPEYICRIYHIRCCSQVFTGISILKTAKAHRYKTIRLSETTTRKRCYTVCLECRESL